MCLSASSGAVADAPWSLLTCAMVLDFFSLEGADGRAHFFGMSYTSAGHAFGHDIDRAHRRRLHTDRMLTVRLWSEGTCGRPNTKAFPPGTEQNRQGSLKGAPRHRVSGTAWTGDPSGHTACIAPRRGHQRPHRRPCSSC